jgi:hypothetical protein
MAELLIKAADSGASRDAWRRGDVVTVKTDGHGWGKEELNRDRFYVLRIPGMTREELQSWLEPDADTVTGPDLMPYERTLGRRRVTLDLDALPKAVLAALKAGRTTASRQTLANATKTRRSA